MQQRVDIRFDDESVQRLLKAVDVKAEAFREEGRAEVRFEVQEEIDRALAEKPLSDSSIAWGIEAAVPIAYLRAAMDRAGQEAQEPA